MLLPRSSRQQERQQAFPAVWCNGSPCKLPPALGGAGGFHAATPWRLLLPQDAPATTCLCFRRGNICARLTLDRDWAMRGQEVGVSVEVDNRSAAAVRHITLALRQTCLLRGGPDIHEAEVYDYEMPAWIPYLCQCQGFCVPVGYAHRIPKRLARQRVEGVPARTALTRSG